MSLTSVKSCVALLPSSTEKFETVGVFSVAVLQGLARVILNVYPLSLPLNGSLVRVDVTVKVCSVVSNERSPVRTLTVRPVRLIQAMVEGSGLIDRVSE